MRAQKRTPVHPGDILLKDYIEPLHLTITGLAISSRRQIHLAVDHGIEGLNEFDLLRKGFDDRQMADFREGQIRRYGPLTYRWLPP